MYPRVVKNILNVSTQLKTPRTLKNFGLIFPALTQVTVQKIIPGTVTSFSNHFCSKPETLCMPREPKLRKQFIEEEAQKEIQRLMEENPELERLQKIYELEIDVMRHDGERVPNRVRPRDWVELLKLPNRSARKKFLDYLFVNEKKRERQIAEKEERRLELEMSKESLDEKIENGEMIYGVGHNSFLRRIVEPTMNALWKWNSLKAVMFGNKIVFDCSYERYMGQQEMKSCAKQILESYAVNRTHNYPFHIYLCNVYMNGELIKRLHRHIPPLFEDDFPITVTSKSYLEIFEQDQIVYLSSDAPNMLEKVDPDKVHIIGAYVDKGPKKPVSFAKAKKENIKMAKLPIDKYLRFGHSSSKDLTLNSVMSIMLDAQTANWNTALKHVPTRKLYEARVNELERKVRNEYLKLKRDLQCKDENYKVYRKPKFQPNKTFDDSSDERKFSSSPANDHSYEDRENLHRIFIK